MVDEEAGKAVAAKAAAMAKQNKALLKQNQQLAEHAAQLAKQNKVILIGVGVVAAAAAVGGAIAHVVKGRKEQKEAESLSEVERSFNAAMKSYLESLRKGQLNEEALAAVVANVDEVKMGLNDGTLTIDFTDGQLDALVMMLRDYTERLAAANGMKLVDPPALNEGAEVSNVILLSHYLGEQQRILQAT